jgi:DNA topoisomerase VI subunit B
MNKTQFCYECERIADIDRLKNEIALALQLGDRDMAKLLRKSLNRQDRLSYWHTCGL